MPKTSAPPDAYTAYLAEQERRAKQTFAVGDIVRLAPDVGTRAQQALIWRVTKLVPVRGQHRIDYAVEPINGGRGLRVQPTHLDPADAKTAAMAQSMPTAERFVVGTVVVARPEARLRGADPFMRLVVIGEAADGTVKVTRLGGDNGRYWTKVRTAVLQKVEV